MPISWNEIRHNAIQFSREWATETREEAEAKSFWDEFFQVFGIRRRTVASFEEPVKKITGDYGYIDLFWPGVLIVEHKSLGKDLGKAGSQAFRYIQDLARDETRRKDIPRYLIVSDFARIALHDLEPEDASDLPLLDQSRVATTEFALADFHRYVHTFAFIPGYKQHRFKEQDPINIEAAVILGELHDALEAGGYTGDHLERFLVRILFCLFAEDTGIFERESFRLYLVNRTAPDGSDLGIHLARLFEILNTPPDRRQRNLDETLATLPYVNGDLFNEHLGFADFNRAMRDALLACCAKDWSRISPAIFGSLFQSIMETKERRQIGAHYTSERDILKVVRSLFLDDLRAEFATRKADRSTGRLARLEEFHRKLCGLRFLDPACGCGNFLVITYRELRAIELDTLLELHGKQTEMTLDDITRLSQVDVDQFYGIEIGEWPSRIAEVALWLMDHQMNLKVSEAFGQLYQRLPLKKSPHIHCANALQLDWKTVLPPEQCSYVLGNPPFIGKTWLTPAQRNDIALVCGDLKNSGLLDYVTGWYFKAAEYIAGTGVVVGFVSTNSITQGEQVGILWNELFNRYRLKIHIAHRAFPWVSEARGKAHVHVIIIGFANFDGTNKRIFDYQGEIASVSVVRNISPYLIEGSDTVVLSRPKPISRVSEMSNGSKPVDGGFLLFTDEEKEQFLTKNPAAAPFVLPFVGSEEFINGIRRWCLWLVDAPPGLIRSIPDVMTRIEGVRRTRLQSRDLQTQKNAAHPSLFAYNRQPQTNYLAIPEVSSERRSYIPIGFLTPSVISSNKIQVVAEATPYHFGVLTSAMHMAWMRQVCGRLESRYSYSAKLVYNNFPWPENPTAKQRQAIETAAQNVLDVRAKFLGSAGGPPADLGGSPKSLVSTGEATLLSPDLGRAAQDSRPAARAPRTSTLADLYDPLSMPPALVRAHADLDRAVDVAYRPQPFESERTRVEHLFALYEKLTAPLLPAAKAKRSHSRP